MSRTRSTRKTATVVKNVTPEVSETSIVDKSDLATVEFPSEVSADVTVTETDQGESLPVTKIVEEADGQERLLAMLADGDGETETVVSEVSVDGENETEKAEILPPETDAPGMHMYSSLGAAIIGQLTFYRRYASNAVSEYMSESSRTLYARMHLDALTELLGAAKDVDMVDVELSGVPIPRVG